MKYLCKVKFKDRKYVGEATLNGTPTEETEEIGAVLQFVNEYDRKGCDDLLAVIVSSNCEIVTKNTYEIQVVSDDEELRVISRKKVIML